MVRINTQELKNIQLEILTTIHDYCIKNDIKYSLTAGSLLGAVRHKGFIPWDDDIDIMMLRDEYEYFINNFSHERYEIISYHKNKRFTMPYCKLIDSKTILIENSTMSLPIGVNIDIFPIDICPPLKKEKIWFRKKHFLDALYTIKKLKVDSNRSFIKNLIILCVKISTFPISSGRLCRLIQKEALRYRNNDDSFKSAILSTGDTKFSYMIPSTVFENYIQLQFEGKKYNCIKNYDSFLQSLYGKDYMKLPPPEKRVAHHGFDAYWKD